MKNKYEKEFRIILTKWGLNLGLRIPKEIVTVHNFKQGEEVVITNTKQGFETIKLFPERADNYNI